MGVDHEAEFEVLGGLPLDSLLRREALVHLKSSMAKGQYSAQQQEVALLFVGQALTLLQELFQVGEALGEVAGQVAPAQVELGREEFLLFFHALSLRLAELDYVLEHQLRVGVASALHVVVRLQEQDAVEQGLSFQARVLPLQPS